MFQAYLLRCSDGRYYAGHTDDLDRRLGEHQTGAIPGYTHTRRPVTLMWSEQFGTREEALAVELQLKGWSRAKKEALIAGDWGAVRRLASRAILRDAASTSSAVPQDERSPFSSVRAEEGLSAGEDLSRSTSAGPSPPPAIILVRPQLGENIGKAARAMLNFGLTDLRLVAPRDGWPNPAAGPAASGADSVLEGARTFDTLAEAVADCAHVYATTVRRRGVSKPVVDPAAAAAAIHKAADRSAIVFGPERSGLETDDVALARTIITVPINPQFGSLNLAQAVILCAYEWSKGEALASPPDVAIDPPAPQAELEGMIAQFDAMLDTAGFFFPPDRAPTVRRTIRTMLTKPAWSAQEVRTMRGMLSALRTPHPR